MPACFKKLSHHATEAFHGRNQSKIQHKFYFSKRAQLEESINHKNLPDKLKELSDQVFSTISPHGAIIRESLKYAQSVEPRVKNKIFLMSEPKFSGGFSEALTKSRELSVMPAALIQLHLQEAVETQNHAMLYQIWLTHLERRSEAGFKDAVDIDAAMASVNIPGQATALAEIAQIKADHKEFEICIAEISGRSVANDKMTLARMRNEVDALANAAQQAA